jgi:glycerate kinase
VPRRNNRLHVLVSPTAYKGTLAPWRAARLIASAFPASFSVQLLPLADGGDGTLDCLRGALGGKLISTRVRGPLGKTVKAAWLLAPRKTAVIEMARASGLALLKGKNRIRDATTFGTGQVINAALDRGCTRLLIGVGGTATADGGAGAMEALGLRYFDKAGRRLSGAPSELARLHRIDATHLDPRLKKTSITVLCDVTNPLLGAKGSAHTFAPQKGATPADVIFLESVMRRWSRFAPRRFIKAPGAGAAGALAFGLSAFAGARLKPGCPFIMKALQWERAARGKEWIVTGEGRLDKTSFGGKVVGAVVRASSRAKIAVICGATPLSTVYLKHHGIYQIETLGRDGLRAPERSLKKASRQLCARLF